METINKKFNMSRTLSYVSLGLLFISATFKLLHLPGASILLFLAFVTIVGSLLVGTLSGMVLNREKRGGYMLLGIVLSIVIFLVSWLFQTLHLPGTTMLRIGSIALMMVLFPALIIHLNARAEKGPHLLTYLREKHTPGIERFLVILIVLSTLLKLMSIVSGWAGVVTDVLLILVIFASGFQFFASNWRREDEGKQDLFFQVLLIVGFLMYLVPSVNVPMLTFQIRVGLATGFYAIATYILAINGTNSKDSTFYGVLALTGLYILMWSGINLGLLPASLNALIYNLPILALLFLCMFFVRKEHQLKTYLIIVIANYMYFYPMENGLL